MDFSLSLLFRCVIVCFVPTILSSNESRIVRVDAAVLLLVSKTQSKPPLGLLIAVDILQAVGLNPLLHATLGFTMGM